MGSLSVWHWVVVLVVVMLFFGGRGKISGLMGDAAKGIRAFKDGLANESDEVVAEAGGGDAGEAGQRGRDKVS